MQHTATDMTATQCKKLQHTATPTPLQTSLATHRNTYNSNTLQRTTTHSNTLHRPIFCERALQHTSTIKKLQHTATHTRLRTGLARTLVIAS